MRISLSFTAYDSIAWWVEDSVTNKYRLFSRELTFEVVAPQKQQKRHMIANLGAIKELLVLPEVKQMLWVREGVWLTAERVGCVTMLSLTKCQGVLYFSFRNSLLNVLDLKAVVTAEPETNESTPRAKKPPKLTEIGKIAVHHTSPDLFVLDHSGNVSMRGLN